MDYDRIDIKTKYNKERTITKQYHRKLLHGNEKKRKLWIY